MVLTPTSTRLTLCTPCFAPLPKPEFAQIAELGIIKLGKCIVAFVAAQKPRRSFNQSLVARQADVAELSFIEVGKGS